MTASKLPGRQQQQNNGFHFTLSKKLVLLLHISQSEFVYIIVLTLMISVNKQ